MNKNLPTPNGAAKIQLFIYSIYGFFINQGKRVGYLIFIDRGWGTEDEGQWEMGDERCMMCEGGMTMTKDHD